MATACLEEVAAAKAPFRQIDRFLRRLKNDPAWTDEEVIEVQTHVIREMMRRMTEDRPSS